MSEDNCQENMRNSIFIIPEYRKINICKMYIGPTNSFSTAPIMLASSAMNLAAILIHLL